MQWLPWPDASVAAVGAAAATRILSRRRGAARRAGLPGGTVGSPREAGRPSAGRFIRVRPAVAAWTRELSIMFGLYALWQLAGSLSLAQVNGAVERGKQIEGFERHLRLPSEAWLQRLVLSDHWLIRLFNIYYVGLHVGITGACLIWVFARHRDRYPAVRNTLALATGACLLVALVPVAPPRLVPGSGLVDTGRLVGPTVYPATARPGLDQLSAMPSVHVAWAIVVAGAVVYALRWRWRWLAVVYPFTTLFIVIVTGNHYWADGFVAAVICAGALGVVAAYQRAVSRRSRSPLTANPADEPVPAGG